MARPAKLEFTPLEFETTNINEFKFELSELEFTPLEFETINTPKIVIRQFIRIYSVGV